MELLTQSHSSAQKLAHTNIHRKRPDYPNLFPFLLSSFVKCSECGASMIGKTEAEVKSTETKVNEPGQVGGMSALPVELETYEALTQAIHRLGTADAATKQKIIDLLVHKIEIVPDGFKVAFYAGEMEIEKGARSDGFPIP